MSQPQTWLLTCICLLPRSWGWCGGRAALLGALTLTGGVDPVSSHRVFLHSLGARGERREAGHKGAQHQDEAQGCHLEVERVWWAEPGQGKAASLATPKALPSPQPGASGGQRLGSSVFFRKSAPRARVVEEKVKDVRPSQPTGERPPQAALEERELASVAIASGVGRNQERKEGVGAGGD